MCLGVGARCEGTSDKPVCVTGGTSAHASSQFQLPPGIRNDQTYFQGKSAADVESLAPVTYNYFGILGRAVAGGLLVLVVRRGLGCLRTSGSEDVARGVSFFDEEIVDTHPLIVEF